MQWYHISNDIKMTSDKLLMIMLWTMGVPWMTYSNRMNPNGRWMRWLQMTQKWLFGGTWMITRLLWGESWITLHDPSKMVPDWPWLLLNCRNKLCLTWSKMFLKFYGLFQIQLMARWGRIRQIFKLEAYIPRSASLKL